MGENTLLAVHDEAQLPVHMTAREVAALFRRSVDTVQRWHKDGTLVGFTPPGGGPRLWKRDVVLAKAREVAPATEQE